MIREQWRSKFEADGEMREVRGESGFDELAIGQWLHLERLDEREWWMRVGKARILVRVSETGDAEEVTIEPDFY